MIFENSFRDVRPDELKIFRRKILILELLVEKTKVQSTFDFIKE